MITAPICTSLGISGQLCSMLYMVIFPWVLTFAVVFGLLIKSKLFEGKDDKSNTSRGVSGLVALAIGFFVTAFVPGYGGLIGNFFINMSGNLMMILFVILGIMLVISLTGVKILNDKSGTWSNLLFLLGIVVVAWFLLGNIFGRLSFSALVGQDAFALVIILAIIGGMWWFTCNGKCDGKTEKTTT